MQDQKPVGLVLILEPGLPATRRNRIRRRLEKLGVEVRYVRSEAGGYLEVIGEDLPVRSLYPEHWQGVARSVSLTPDAPHASWGESRSHLLL